MSSNELQPPLDPDFEPDELTDTVVRGAGLAGAGYIAAQVFTLGFYIALARLASPQNFGDLAAGTLLVNIAMLFSESGMMAALIHRRDRIDEAASTATISTALGGVAMSLAALAASPLIGEIFQSSTVRDVAAGSSGLLLLRSLRVVPDALLQRRFSFLRRLIIEPTGVLVFGTVAVITTANGMGVWGLVIGYYASETTDLILSWGLLGWRPNLRRASVAMWRELMRYGRYIIVTAALERSQGQVPVLLLGRFVGVGALGQFRYASRMEQTSASIMVQSAAYVLFPAMARIRSERDRFLDASLRSLRSMCAIGFPLGGILVPLGVPLALVFFGDIWKDAGYAAMALAAVSVAIAPISFASETVKADGRPDILARVHVVNLVATSVFMVALLPLDLVGVCAGLAVGTWVTATYALFKVGEHLETGTARLVAQMLPYAGAAIFMVGVLTPLEFLIVHAGEHGTVLGLLLLGFESLLGVGLYIGALATISHDDLAELISTARRLLPGSRGKQDETGLESPPPTASPAKSAR